MATMVAMVAVVAVAVAVVEPWWSVRVMGTLCPDLNPDPDPDPASFFLLPASCFLIPDS